MRKGIIGLLLGSIGAVFLSVIAAAIYDFIKGNDLFVTFGRFFTASFKLMMKKVSGSDVPLWVLLLLLLAVIVVIVTVLGRRSQGNKKRKRTIRYKLVRQP